MHFQRLWILSLTVTAVAFVTVHQTAAQEKRITYDHLAALGEIAWRLHDFRDNKFLYEEKTEQVKSYAKLLQGAELTFHVGVVRVTKLEVVCQTYHAGRTRVVVYSERPDIRPGTELSRYRLYSGPPSANRYNKLAAPTTFQIGEQIDLELAKQLREDDMLEIKGIVNIVETRIPSEFRHDTNVYLRDVRVVGRLGELHDHDDDR